MQKARMCLAALAVLLVPQASLGDGQLPETSLVDQIGDGGTAEAILRYPGESDAVGTELGRSSDPQSRPAPKASGPQVHIGDNCDYTAALPSV